MRFLQPAGRGLSVPSALAFSFVFSLAPQSFSATEGPLRSKTETRKASPPLASLSAPAAAGPLRILVVDDDGSHNNNTPGDSRVTVSDQFFLAHAAEAVDGEKDRWSVVHVPVATDGPTVERLQAYNLILWYTGASYGGNPDNTSVLSLRDEKTVRQYLAQTGGTVVLVSPGYVSKVLDNASTFDDSSWPFLSEVMGVRGGKGLAQRFIAGTVLSASGASYNITGGGYAVETQLSLVNPDGASVLFSTVPADAKPGTNPSPVATVFPYGKGRMIYIGFTLENVAAEQASAIFQEILSATGLISASSGLRATLPIKTSPAIVTSDGSLRPPTAAQVLSASEVTDAAQSFSVRGKDRQSFNFYTSQAGPIQLRVQATGAPVVVKVFHPDGRVNTETGQGNFVVQDTADANDAARGHIWAVSVQLSSPSPSRTEGASGTVVVSHPPADQAAVAAQLRAAKPKTAVLGKALPVRSISSLPENLRIADATRVMAPSSRSSLASREIELKRVPTLPSAVPSPVIKLAVDGPPGEGAVPANVIGVRNALYVIGTDLDPPGVSAQELNSHPDQYAAELHFEYGSGMSASATCPLQPSPIYGARFMGRVPPIPGALDVPVSVYLKTTDGRTSNRVPLVYHPRLITKEINLPIIDYNVVNNIQTAPFNFLDWLWGYKTGLDPDWGLYDSSLDPSYSDANVAPRAIIRDTYLFGFFGNDVFYKTLQLKNDWKTVSAKISVWESRGGGAEVIEFTPGSSSLYCKVHWYLDPAFLDSNILKYSVDIVIEGPADFSPL